MSVNGITDIVTTVTVPKSEYETLVRDSESLDILKALLRNNEYVGDKLARAILGVCYKESEVGGNE